MEVARPQNRLNWFQATADGPAYFDGHLRDFLSVLYWDATGYYVLNPGVEVLPSAESLRTP